MYLDGSLNYLKSLSKDFDGNNGFFNLIKKLSILNYLFSGLQFGVYHLLLFENVPLNSYLFL